MSKPPFVAAPVKQFQLENKKIVVAVKPKQFPCWLRCQTKLRDFSTLRWPTSANLALSAVE